MLFVCVLLFAFCQYATSKTIADNAIPENMQAYSDESLWDPADMDTQFLSAQYDKLIESKPVQYEEAHKFPESLDWNAKNLNHMTKRTYEQYLPYINEDDYAPTAKERRTTGARDARGDNFMRFGRAQHDDYMRFGRSPHEDFMRFGRSLHDDYMRFGRSAADDYMRFGRTPHDNYMRFGRNAGADILRFGKANNNILRSGRTVDKSDVDDIRNMYARYGRPENFMRFGRTAKSNEKDLSPDFMRFGRSVNALNKTKSHGETASKQ